jgi:dienelactone hydrolase
MLSLEALLSAPLPRRICHSHLLWRVLGVLLVLEGLLGMSWFLYMQHRPPGHLHYAIGVLAAHVIALLAFLCGGRAEQREGWLTRLSRALEARRSCYGDVVLGEYRSRPTPRPSREPVRLGSPEAMCVWRESTRHQLIEDLYAMAFLRKVRAPAIRIAREVALAGGVVRTLMTFEAVDGTAIPAFLFRPRAARHAPAVLVVPGHGRGIVETAGIVKSYQNGAALALARAGFIVLSPELRGFGHLGASVGIDHEHVAHQALRDGTSYHALLLRDLRTALTLLLDEPGVDVKRVAVTGCSLGGDLSITLGALDSRIAAVVAQGLINWRGPRGRRPTPEEDSSAFNRDICNLIPGEATLAHYEDRFLLVCPRPFALINGRRDVGDMREDENWLLSLLRRAYQLEGSSERFAFELMSGGHEYYLGPAIRFLCRTFGSHYEQSTEPMSAGRTRGFRQSRWNVEIRTSDG